MWFIDQRSIHHLCRCTNISRGRKRAHTHRFKHTCSLPAGNAAAAPHYRASHLRRAAGNNGSANMSLPHRHSGRSLSGPRSTTFGRRITRKLSWPTERRRPKGEDCGFESAGSLHRALWTKNAKNAWRAPRSFYCRLQKSERPLNLRRNRYAPSQTGRYQRRFTAGVADKTPRPRRRAPLSERTPPRRDGAGAQLEPRDARRGRRAGGRAAITWRARPSWLFWLFWRPAALERPCAF